jgi:hypothetical protein
MADESSETVELLRRAAAGSSAKSWPGCSTRRPRWDRYARTAEADRLEGLVLAVNRKLADPELPVGEFLKAERVLVELSARKSKLLGLDSEPRWSRPPELPPPPAPPPAPVDDDARLAALISRTTALSRGQDRSRKPRARPSTKSRMHLLPRRYTTRGRLIFCSHYARHFPQTGQPKSSGLRAPRQTASWPKTWPTGNKLTSRAALSLALRET